MQEATLQTSDINKKLLLFITITSNFVNPLMGSAVNVALPKIGSDFSLDAVGLSWVTMAYLLASGVCLVPFGKLSDLWGRKKIFLYGNAIFAIASLLCAISFSGNSLISFRFLQGIGSAMMFSTSMAIIISAFPPQERGKIIGFNVSAVYVGLSIAPVLGGYLTENLGWKSLFMISAIISALLTVLIFTKIKVEWTEKTKERFDWLGTLIYLPSMTALMYGFSKLPTSTAIVLTSLGLIGLIAFIRVELKSTSPVLNIKLFIENKVFAGANLSAFINYAATFAVSFVLSLYLQYAKHLSPKEAGMLLITQPVFMAVTSIFSGRLSDKINPKWFASTGMAVSAVGLLALVNIHQETSNLYLVSSLAILGFGFGLFSSPNTTLLMSSVEKKHYNLASATISTMRTTGMMFSMAIASLAIHFYLGNQKINESTISTFILSNKVVFLTFSILCIIGVFLSLVGKKQPV